jgi:hypothetical protein
MWEYVKAVVPEWKVIYSRRRFGWERAVKMRKECPAAGFFPFKAVPQLFRVDRQKQQTTLSGSVFRRALNDLLGSRKMDESIGLVLGRTRILAALLG